MSDEAIDPRAFGASFKTFMQQMASQAPEQEPEIRRRVREHFGADPTNLPIVGEQFPTHDHVNLHLALEAYLAEPGRESEVVGVQSPHAMFGVQLAQLVAPPSAEMQMRGGSIGPVEYVNLPLDQDRVVACVRTGLFFARNGDERVLILLSATEGYREKLGIEVMAATRPQAEATIAGLRTAMRKRNVYRGRVISLAQTNEGLDVKFHRLPPVTREGIILPDGLLDRIERQAVRFSQLREELRRMGRHLKRGLLLHGPPGTGKTLTAMYLAGQMPDRTVLLLTGRGLGTIEQSCTMARMLEPATVIMEDVDLIAEERTQQNVCQNSLLFELLNQMDGINEDADVLFVLTTNRPDVLEPALASRPGRIDLALEVPLPDATCRSRLLDLYAKGLDLRLTRRESIVNRTKGVSAAFIRELLRKAALAAADEGSGVVEDRHLDAALRDLVVEGGRLTKTLLGYGDLSATE